jgi:methylated-DNA-protein-cysteine methyltransferase-like protein
MAINEESVHMLYLSLANVPEGKAITYGDLSRLAGHPNGARWAGRLLSQLPADTNLPWHRVVNSKGEITCPNRNQARDRLRKEGVIVNGFRIALGDYRNTSNANPLTAKDPQ